MTGGSDSDTLAVTGGSFTNVTETFSSTTDGIVRLTQAGSVTRTIDYTGLSPVLLNVGTVADVVFHLPAGPNTNVVLADDGAAPDPNGNTANTSAIYGGTFEYTEFTNPANSLTVNLGPQGDTISVQTMDALFQPAGGTPLIINGGAGSDTFNVTPSATVPLHVNGGDPIGVLPGTGDTLNAVVAAFTLQPGPERDSGSFVSTAAAFAPVSFDQIERIRVNGAVYVPSTPSVPDLVATSDTFDNLGFGTPLGNSTDNLTNLSQPTFIGTGPAEGTVRIYAGGILVGEAAVGSDATDGTAGDGLGRWEVTVGPLADGSYPITAQVEDWAGNLSAASAALTPVVVDTLPPQRPTLDLLAASDSGASNLDGVTNQASPISITVTGDVGSRVVIRNGAAVADDFTMPAGGTTARTLALSTDGSYLLSAEAFDAAGNRSAQSEQLTLTVDRSIPAAPSQPDLLAASDSGFSATDNNTAVRQPAFSGTGEANAKVRVCANGELVGHGVVNTAGTWEITVEPLVDGVYNITAVQEDLAGNVSDASTLLPIVIDSYGPNSTLATASVLGSSPTVTLDGVTLHYQSGVPSDVDFFALTAHDTGKLLVRATGTNLGLEVQDSAGATIVTTTATTNPTLTLPAISRQTYYVRLTNTASAANQYALELENIPVPQPTLVTLLPADDTGLSNCDSITRLTTPCLYPHFSACSMRIPEESERSSTMCHDFWY